jgi:hypothetical protein
MGLRKFAVRVHDPEHQLFEADLTRIGVSLAPRGRAGGICAAVQFADE